MLIVMSQRSDTNLDQQALDAHPDFATSASFFSTFEGFITQRCMFWSFHCILTSVAPLWKTLSNKLLFLLFGSERGESDSHLADIFHIHISWPHCCGSGSVESTCFLGLPDPDPLVRDTHTDHSIIQGFGSGSVSGSGSAWIRINLSCWIRIRIRTQIADPNPDPGGQKWPQKIEKRTEFSSFEVLDVLFWGL